MYCEDIGKGLVDSFSRAGKGTTPGLIGSARENSVRKKLKYLLPPNIGVGTGCVFDVNGNVSMQQDIIIFEKDLCPVFCINDSQDVSYYPCEGVIAVGEIKSTVGKKELKNIFEKIDSVKQLKRYSPHSLHGFSGKLTRNFRLYGSKMDYQGTKEEEFNQETNTFDQIYGFAICDHISSSDSTFIKNLKECMSKITSISWPNLFITLDKKILVPINLEGTAHQISAQMDKQFYFTTVQENCFPFLLFRIYQIIEKGRSVPISSFRKYINNELMPLPAEGFIIK